MKKSTACQHESEGSLHWKIHSIAKEFMHLLIFLHTLVINLYAISWASKQVFPQLCIAKSKAGLEKS